MNKRLLSFGLGGILIIGMLIGMFFSKKDSIYYIEKRMKIELRENVSIVKEQRQTSYGEEHVDVKLLVKKGKEKEIKRELEKYFPKEFPKETITPKFQNTCPWWDMKEENIINKYFMMTEGKRAKTLLVWAFIVKEGEKEYVYISY